MIIYPSVKRNTHAPVAQLDRVTDYESVGQGFESLPAYQKSGYPIRDNRFFNTRVDSKARPRRSRGEKHAGGMFFRAWESPCMSGRIRYGCGRSCSRSARESLGIRTHPAWMWTKIEKYFEEAGYPREYPFFISWKLENITNLSRHLSPAAV